MHAAWALAMLLESQNWQLAQTKVDWSQLQLALHM